MKTLSLDMSTTCVGISIWNDDELVKAFKIKADKKLGWEERVRSFRKPLELIIIKYNIDFILCEAVPLVSKGRIDMTAQAKATFVKLGAMRGMIISLADIHNIEFQAIPPNTWRKNIGILQGKKDRATKKVMAIKLVNKLFDLKLKKHKKNDNKRLSLLIFSIIMHNIPEGMAIGVAFGSVIYGLDGATVLSAITLAIGIGIQNFPEGAAISLPMRREGNSRLKSFLIGSLSGIVEPISALLGAILVLKMQVVLPYLLSFAAGAMLYVVIEEIIPESQLNKNKGLIALLTLVGFCIMMILDVALG